MDVEKLVAKKRKHSLHHSQAQLQRLIIDDFKVDEDVHPNFSCPCCFDDQKLD